MPRHQRSQRVVALLALVALGAGASSFVGRLAAQGPADALAAGFADPPASARPRVWWHWMNGNVTKEGITRDLEWMARVGLGGFQNFDAALTRDQVVEKRLVYMTPEWKDAFHHAMELADRLGLEAAIAGSPGWSESGGPWVTPQQAMKKLVWSETRVVGGQPFTGTLAKPPSTTGPFQNVPRVDALAAISGQAPIARPELYTDVAVVAFPVPMGDVAPGALRSTVTSSAGAVDAAALTDGDYRTAVSLPTSASGATAWIQFAFAQPQRIRGVSVAFSGLKWPFGPPPPGPDLEVSDDGATFRKIVTVPRSTAEQNTVSFEPVRARHVRMVFPPPRQMDFGLSDVLPPAPPITSHHVAELVLHTGARVHRFEEKAAFAPLAGLSALPTPQVPSADAIRPSEIVDLTSRLRGDGTLDWTPPAGTWVVMRFGYSLLGVTNHPASPEGTGLEVDKLNPDHVRSYMTTYLDQYKSAAGELMGARGLRFLISDSWEAGAQNWTERMSAEFSTRRGYPLVPWLPALTGRVVESAEATDRFLWDFRRTLSDMLAEHHYDLITAILKERGMGHYGESHEAGRAFIGDGMQVKRTNDVPMAAIWTQRPGVNEEQYGYNADIRESASVAHIYGQPFVAAESLTAASGAWAWTPETLKPTADNALAMGLNRFVIHTSVHQPLVDRGPGLSLGPFGQWFTRNETWAELATPWIRYLSRSSFLLQQGRFVADVAYFYGEDTNVTALFRASAPPIPPGYNFDYVNADALTSRFSVNGGRLVTPTGMEYRVLALDPNCRQMSLPVLKKIRDLVNGGAVVVGSRPVGSPSRSDNDTEFGAIAAELWGTDVERTVGRGVVHNSTDLQAVLTRLQVAPDFQYSKPADDTRLLFVHRALADGDIYFVSNRRDRAESVDATFRVAGREPEIWHADTGARDAASFTSVPGRTTVPLRLDPWGSVFVVFRQATTESSRSIPAPAERSLVTVRGPWTLAFQADRGAPAQVSVEALRSWTEHPDAGVRYFSGTAVYSTVFEMPATAARGRQFLDLGDVKNIAEVLVNGTPAGTVWKRPFRVDITEALQPGTNRLEVRVTNTWVNRMIGDRQPGAPRQYTFTSPVFYKADSPLVPSGLIGPVQVVESGSRE